MKCESVWVSLQEYRFDLKPDLVLLECTYSNGRLNIITSLPKTIHFNHKRQQELINQLLNNTLKLLKQVMDCVAAEVLIKSHLISTSLFFQIALLFGSHFAFYL